MFGLFERKRNIDAPLIGWFRLEVFQITEIENGSDEYNNMLRNCKAPMLLLIATVDRDIMKDFASLLNEVVTNRHNEVMAEFVTLLFFRNSIASLAHEKGVINDSERDINYLATSLLKQTKIIAPQLKNKQ